MGQREAWSAKLSMVDPQVAQRKKEEEAACKGDTKEGANDVRRKAHSFQEKGTFAGELSPGSTNEKYSDGEDGHQ